MTEVVKILPATGGHGGSTWMPTIGDEIEDFLDGVHEDARDRVRTQAVRILSRSQPPGQDGVRAELVVGYVQSGKTMSFTAAAALARDNGFGLVIVVAGTSQKLLDQTRERLRDDLKLDHASSYSRWIPIDSPKRGSEEARKIAAVLEDWADPMVDSEDRVTVLITVMKQHQRLQWLAEVLEDIGSAVDLSAVPTLVIDDEADQASPNVKKRPGEESTTYSRIRRLRDALPAHTLLEYTATPQATLLMSLADSLSPEYVTVLDPGPAYTGGQHFFKDHRSRFVRTIPDADAQVIDDPDQGPPRSLLDAFACFSLGCAAGSIDRRPDPPQRSMLVHPSQKTLPHEQFVSWLQSIRDSWIGLLKLEVDDPDREELIRLWLEPAYADLAQSVADLPPFEDLLSRLPRVMARTEIKEVNAAGGKKDPIPWSTGYAWILVGGQMLDRGFTVEGLTVTYMPRRMGVGNADTIQQRARFFGYKAGISGYCRAWLDPTVASAFEKYVEHEEHMRLELRDIDETGQSLKQWRRRFLLDPTLKLTRSSVIRLDLDRSRFGDEWFHPWYVGCLEERVQVANRDLVAQFFEAHPTVPDPDSPHHITDAPLETVLAELLEEFVVDEDDAIKFASLKLLLAVAADEGGQAARVVRMRPGPHTDAIRSIDKDGRLKSLLQGRNKGYKGDREVKADGQITVQVHHFNLEGPGGELVAANAPIVAIWVPKELEGSVITERRS